MTIDTKVATAYATTTTFETQVVKDIADKVDTFNADLDAIIARFPDAAKIGAVYQFANQARSMVGSLYQLNTLKTQFGVTPAPTPMAPPMPTPTA